MRKSPSKGKYCLECKIQGQERETKDFTILPKAKYAHHKQAGINMDEHFILQRIEIQKKIFRGCPFVLCKLSPGIL